MKVPSCPANVTILDQDGNEYLCLGRYYGDGRILAAHEGKRLLVDPANYREDDPKRMFDYDRLKWTRYRVKSVILDAAAIRKTGSTTRSQNLGR